MTTTFEPNDASAASAADKAERHLYGLGEPPPPHVPNGFFVVDRAWYDRTIKQTWLAGWTERDRIARAEG